MCLETIPSLQSKKVSGTNMKTLKGKLADLYFKPGVGYISMSFFLDAQSALITLVNSAFTRLLSTYLRSILCSYKSGIGQIQMSFSTE